MTRRITISLVCGLAITPIARAEEPKKAAKPAAGQPDDAAMKEYFEKYATPGDGHKPLKALVGNWNAQVTMWMAPDAPPQTSTSTSKGELIMGDRYLREEFRGTFMGQPFQGLSLTGFDNYKKEYVSTWIDSMGTGMMISRGKADANGKVITQTGEWDDPMIKKTKKMRMVTRIENDNKHVMEMYEKIPGKKEYKSMEIVYTRAGK